jgi:TctA family transporter
MKQLRWPRPPLILGFVLGAIIERYMFISTARYGFEWLLRPVVVILLGLAVLGLLRPLIGELLAQRRPAARRCSTPRACAPPICSTCSSAPSSR